MTISQATQATVVAAVETIVLDDSWIANRTGEMIGINAFDLLRSLERQTSQVQAEVETEPDEEVDDVDVDPADSPPQAMVVANAPTVQQATLMSVSVPNLRVSTSESREERETAEGAIPAAILESFTNLSRRFVCFIHPSFP